MCKNKWKSGKFQVANNLCAQHVQARTTLANGRCSLTKKDMKFIKNLNISNFFYAINILFHKKCHSKMHFILFKV